MESQMMKYKLILVLTLSILTFISHAQYLHVDRVSIKSGVALNGEITEDIKQEYLIIKTEEYGLVKVKYSDVKYVLRKPNLNDPFYKKGAHQYFSVGLGYGPEYAGIGTRAQIRIGRKTGASTFFGIGSFFHGTADGSGKMQIFSISSGIKFYPYQYFYIGVGAQVEFTGTQKGDGIFFVGIDYPINHFLLNASFGYFDNSAFRSHTGQLMINLGISYKITTNPVQTQQKPTK